MMVPAINIAAIRRRWGMSQADFGVLLDATRTQVSNWERRCTAPTFQDICRLAELTGISAERLHSSELTLEMIPLMPLSAPALVVIEDTTVLELRKINEQLGEIKTLLARLVEINMPPRF